MADVGAALFREIPNPKKRKLLARIAHTGRLTVRGQKDDWSDHYRWLKADPAYAAAYKLARAIAGDMLEAEAYRRAFAGSDTLIIFLLKAHKPELYRERLEQTGKDGGPITIQVVYDSSSAGGASPSPHDAE